MNIIRFITMGCMLGLSVHSQAGQIVHIGSVNINDSNGLSIVNGRVVSGSQDVVKGTGVVQQDSRTLHSFIAVKIGISADVHIIQGDKSVCIIEGDANILPLITTDVQDEVLTITSNKNFSSNTRLSVQITTPALSKVDLAGSGDVTLDKIQGQTLNLLISGSGNLRASGHIITLKARIKGAGDMHLFALQAHAVDAILAGTGTIQVYASETFGGTIEGSGDILVHGHPQITRSVVNGAGNIVAE